MVLVVSLFSSLKGFLPESVGIAMECVLTIIHYIIQTLGSNFLLQLPAFQSEDGCLVRMYSYALHGSRNRLKLI